MSIQEIIQNLESTYKKIDLLNRDTIDKLFTTNIRLLEHVNYLHSTIEKMGKQKSKRAKHAPTK